MSRNVGGALGFLMMATALANAQEDGPPLAPPALSTPGEAPSPPPAPKPTSTPAARRPFLVIPGVNTPAAGRPPRTEAVEPGSESTAPPTLAGPAPAARHDPMTPTVTIPLTLEPIPDGDPADEPPMKKPAASTKPRATTTAPPSAEEGGGMRYAPGSMLGRILGINDRRDDVSNAISVESKSDPAVDAAVKRRIEKVVEESLGDRVSTVEVRVKGRSVLIRARASRFWHRRGVRRALDSIQLPSGYHGRAELID
mgnify:CR=1 FL=1